MNEPVKSMMTKQEAEEKIERIVQKTGDWYEQVAPIVADIRDREGWKVLGFSSFKDYARSLGEELGWQRVYQHYDKAVVERISASSPAGTIQRGDTVSPAM